MSATPEHAARVLGMTDEATLADVRRVRRELAFKYHPDRSSDPARSSRHMARINAAADTLIAHLRGQAPKPSKPERPEGHGFSDRKTTRQASAKCKTSNTTSDRTKTDPDRTTSRPENNAADPGKEHAAHAMTAQPHNGKRSPADTTLIRLAAASYRNVLERIGTVAPAPTIDMKVLCYPGSH